MKPPKAVSEYMSKIGAKGGAAGKRILTREQSLAMVKAKAAKKAAKQPK